MEMTFDQLKLMAAALSCYQAYLELKLEQARKLSPTAFFPDHIQELHELTEFRLTVEATLYELSDDDLSTNA